MDFHQEGRRTLQRLLSSADLSSLNKSHRNLFVQRLEAHFEALFSLLFETYGHRYDFYFYLQQLINTMAAAFAQRPAHLKRKDSARVANPLWYRQQNMLGMALYVDLFAGDLKGLQARIPYLQSLGITFVHLLPLYAAPAGDSDGGYAVSDYRSVDPKLGNIDDLRKLAKAMDQAGISLVLDFVFNHTSDEHRWALEAKKGDAEFQGYYYMFDDRSMPDAYDQHLREIFPQVRRGNFTWNEEAGKWVWTTFNNFQWDLNYSNPAVFNAITDEMLFLANVGCETLRLDALAFIWKEMGTNCENQPKAHTLIKAFNRCLQICAPAVVFKSEAIVHPDEVLKYIDKDECQLSYNPLLMALLWNSLATRKTRLLTASMRKSFSISPDCAWVNYVRCHDDIGWTFDDAVAGHLGISGFDHRNFLNAFYTDRFDGSFAKGVPFAENPSTGDCRICGSLASLAGLEKALEEQNPEAIEQAIKRILLLHAVILSIGGIPLIYSGDEVGLLNDYRYADDDAKMHDSRWVHRIPLQQGDIDKAMDKTTAQYHIAQGLQHMIRIRQRQPIFGLSDTHILETDNPHVFAYTRHADNGTCLLALTNFSDYPQQVNGRILEHLGVDQSEDLLSHQRFEHSQETLGLAPYQVLWIKAKE